MYIHALLPVNQLHARKPYMYKVYQSPQYNGIWKGVCNVHVHVYTHVGASVFPVSLFLSLCPQSQYQEISRVISVGERLVAARHYALDVMQVGNRELRSRWEKFSAIMEDRNNMFELSVVFHDWKQKVHVHVHVYTAHTCACVQCTLLQLKTRMYMCM